MLQRADNTVHNVPRRLLDVPMDPESTNHPSDDESSKCSDLGPGNLALRFEEAQREVIRHFDDAESLALKQLIVANIKETLNEFGIGCRRVRKMWKVDLIDLLVTEMKNSLQRNKIITEKQTVAIKPSRASQKK